MVNGWSDRDREERDCGHIWLYSILWKLAFES